MSFLQKHFASLSAMLLGVIISWIFSHPSSGAKRKMPVKSAKNIHFLPNLKIHRDNHYYHLHHWVYFGLTFIVLMIFRKTFRGKKVAEGFLLGLVIQGLTYGDRFKIKFVPGLLLD